MKKLIVVTLIASSVLMSGCGLKVNFGGTNDPTCTILCSGTL